MVNEFEIRLKRLTKLDSVMAYEYYRNRPIDFINDWGITYDPRLTKNKLIPFKLFDRQREFLQFIEDRYNSKENGLCEKSRDSGMSWLSIAWSIHKWIYEDGFSVGFGSRKADFVDKIGDPSSILQKGRMFIQYLPNFFLPNGFNSDKHLSYMKFINPLNGAIITGESGDNIGRGGRTSIYFKDESAFYERPELIEASLVANTDVQIDISTPNGLGNPFHRKATSGKISKFRFHWRDDPRKNKKWADRKRDEVGDSIFAQEYDIDYSSSIPNITIPAKWVLSAVELDIIPSGKKVSGLDVADDGDDLNAICIRHGSKVTHIEDWKGIDTTQTAYKSLEISKKLGVEVINFDSIGVGAGAKGAFNSMQKTIKHIPINVGKSPTNIQYGDKRAKDKFRNLKAELWWRLRERFENTYKYTNGDNSISEDDIISIPNDTELITELSQPLYFFNENGKIQIEKKADMKKRGIKSPNKADALVLTFAETKKDISILWK